MGEWTTQDWIVFLGALGSFVTLIGTTVTGIILQLRGNAKTDAAKAISADSNAKVTAVVAQVRNIADAVPGASTDPTDVVIQRGEAVPGAQRATD